MTAAGSKKVVGIKADAQSGSSSPNAGGVGNLYGTLWSDPGVGSYTDIEWTTKTFSGTYPGIAPWVQYPGTNFYIVQEFTNPYSWTLYEYVPASQTIVQHNTVTLTLSYGYAASLGEAVSSTLIAGSTLGTFSTNVDVFWLVRSGSTLSLIDNPVTPGYPAPGAPFGYGNPFKIDSTHAGFVHGGSPAHNLIDVFDTSGRVAQLALTQDTFTSWGDLKAVSTTQLLTWSSPTTTPTTSALDTSAFDALVAPATISGIGWGPIIDATHRFVGLQATSGSSTVYWVLKVQLSGTTISILNSVATNSIGMAANSGNQILVAPDPGSFQGTIYDSNLVHLATGNVPYGAPVFDFPGDGTADPVTGERFIYFNGFNPTTYALSSVVFHPTVNPAPATIDCYDPDTGDILHTRSDAGYKIVNLVSGTNGKIVAGALKYTHYDSTGLPDGEEEGFLVYPPDLSAVEWHTFSNFDPDVGSGFIPIGWWNQLHGTPNAATTFEYLPYPSTEGAIFGYDDTATVVSELNTGSADGGTLNYGTYSVGPHWSVWCWAPDYQNIYTLGVNSVDPFDNSIFYGPPGGPYTLFYDNSGPTSNLFGIRQMTADRSSGLLYVAWMVPAGPGLRAIHVVQYDASGHVANTYAPSDFLLLSYSGDSSEFRCAMDVVGGKIYLSYFQAAAIFADEHFFESDNNLIFKIDAATGVGASGHWTRASVDRAVTGLFISGVAQGQATASAGIPMVGIKTRVQGVR